MAKARPFRRRISRKFSHRREVEVFDFHSNESRISAAKWIALRLKNLLAVSGRVFRRNPQFGRRNPGSFFVLKSRPFLFPYVPTQFVLANWNSLLCSFGRGGALLIQSCDSPVVGFPFVNKNQPQKRRATRAVATNFSGWFCAGKNGPEW